MEENKKVRNARRIEYENIKFRSKLELDFYKIMKEEEGLNVEYETKKIVLLEGFFPPSFLFIYDLVKPRLQRRVFGLNNQKILSMTYSPDFYLDFHNCDIYIEAKGNPNDTYPLKKKLFLAYLVKEGISTGRRQLFFEPHSKKQLREAIKIIREL